MSDFLRDDTGRFIDGPRARVGWIPIQLTTLRELSSGGTINLAGHGGQLASDSTPILNTVNGDTDGAHRLSWASSNSDAVGFSVPLPPDLDFSQNILIKFLASMAGATDTPVFSADSYFGLADTKVEDDSTAITGTTVTEYTITIAAADIEKIGNKRTLSVELTPGAHTTDALYLFALWIEYSKI